MTLTIALSVLSAVGIVLAAWVVFYEYPRSAVDSTRNELFEIRHELFKIAQSGKVAFDNPGYLAARDTINGMIRYAHDVSLLQLLFSKIMETEDLRITRKESGEKWHRAMNSVPKKAKKEFAHIINEAGYALARLVVMRSPVLSAIVGSMVVAKYTGEVLSAFSRGFHQSIKTSKKSTPKSNAEVVMEDVMSHGPMKPVRARIVVETRTRYSGLPDDCLPMPA